MSDTIKGSLIGIGLLMGIMALISVAKLYPDTPAELAEQQKSLMEQETETIDEDGQQYVTVYTFDEGLEPFGVYGNYQGVPQFICKMPDGTLISCEPIRQKAAYYPKSGEKP